REQVIERAREFGLKYMITVGTNSETNEAAFQMAKTHPGIFHSAGLHPHHANEIAEDEFKRIKAFVIQSRPCAIGEIGLDYFKSVADAQTQKDAFTNMLRLALEVNLPVIVHSRNAFKDTLRIITEESKGRLKGVMHCFSYDEDSLKQLLDLGFFVSFTCNLTFKNVGPLLEVVKKMPLDRLMLETDSPYLAPQIYRGKRNEPSCLVHLAQFLSLQLGLHREKLEQVTTENAIRFFNLPSIA
ncbi:MAG: hydrolase TatD, partial [Candidatus Omnitrophica bacterium CG07_land_8_20_14_0_80_50_8]